MCKLTEPSGIQIGCSCMFMLHIVREKYAFALSVIDSQSVKDAPFDNCIQYI